MQEQTTTIHVSKSAYKNAYCMTSSQLPFLVMLEDRNSENVSAQDRS